ncbi:MAG TPA: NAD(P)-dependent alcohol dehydrogenase [Candidatus Sulfotelmatobacter sp.]|nr:NAD(P)-dependent alcohol dehydrogenase [Candidatus Sulfotelmatobacter sp.]
MKAIVYRRYGSPEVLSLEEMEKPQPSEDEVLIKVRAASVNPYDWHFMRGEPYFLRMLTGVARPKSPRLGADVAGDVETVGKNVAQFKPGDAVFGTCHGSFAEYVCGIPSRLASNHQNLNFEEAACIPIAALTALQALRDKARLRPGHKVLINGAAGGVGTFAVQIAKNFGAEVTAVCSTRKLQIVRSIGADQVIDYARDDFTKGSQRFDVILDLVGNHPLSSCGRIMNAHGIYVGAGGTTDPWMIEPLAQMLTAVGLSLYGGRKFTSLLARIHPSDLSFVAELMQTGKVTPVIDRRYTLQEVPDAMRYVEEGHAGGKVVIGVA